MSDSVLALWCKRWTACIAIYFARKSVRVRAIMRVIIFEQKRLLIVHV